MIVVNDTIIGYGMAQADTIGYQQGVILVKVDSSGNLVKSNVIVDSSGDLLSIDKSWGKITAAQDGGYAMTTAPLVSNSAWLVKVDSELEVEFIKEYPDTVNASNFWYSILEIDGGYILYGSIQDPDLVLRPFVRRVDENGEIVWHKYFGDPNFWGNVLDVDILDDSTLVVGSAEHTTFEIGSSAPAKTVIRYLNLNGDIIDSWESEPDPDIGYLRKINVTGDNGIIIYGKSIVDVTSQGVKIVQPTLSKLNGDFEIEWVKRYGRTGSLGSQVNFLDIEPTPDGNFIAAGESIVEINGDKRASGWLMKFSPEGDSIWSRHDLPPFQSLNLNDHFFGGVGVLSSGSIVAGGSATEQGQRYIWLVKVTADGCLVTLYCGLVPTYETVPEVEVAVFPNPCRELVYVELKDYLPKNVKIVLYDAIGQRYKVQPLLAGRNTIWLDGLQAGLYFYEIRESGALLKSGKLVKME